MAEVMTDFPIEINPEEVLRYLGRGPGRRASAEPVREMVEREITGARRLISPRAVYATLEVGTVTVAAVTLPSAGLVLNGKAIAGHLRRAVQVTLFAATVGSALETEVQALFAAGEYSRAVILDAVGSEAAEGAAAAVNRVINAAAGAAGFATVTRFSPGYGDWDIQVQSELLAAVEAERIGVTVNPAAMLLPRKTVTAVIGWVRAGEGCEDGRGCQACDMRECSYRKTN